MNVEARDLLKVARRLCMALCAGAALVPVAGVAGAPGGAGTLPQGVTALGPLTVPAGERYSIQSAKVGKPFIIEVVRVDNPAGPPSAGRLPVVFTTDLDSFSTMVPAIVRSGAGLFPSLLVVGIGYDTSGAAGPLGPLVEAGVRRAEDFTPSHDSNYRPFTPQALQLFEQLGVRLPETRTGRADTFLAFINEELKPFIAARYPADVADSTLVGHSMGGLFTLHVLFTSPGSFRRYIALSPDATYDSGILFREEQALREVSARLFIGLGGEDLPGILESTPRLDARIRARSRPGLRYTYKLFPGESHLSVYPGGVMAGLRAVFDLPVPPGLPQAPAPSAR